MSLLGVRPSIPSFILLSTGSPSDYPAWWRPWTTATWPLWVSCWLPGAQGWGGGLSSLGWNKEAAKKNSGFSRQHGGTWGSAGGPCLVSASGTAGSTAQALSGWLGVGPVGPSLLPTVNEKVPISQVCGEDEVMRLTLETCILIGLAYTTSGMIKKWGFSDDRIALDCIGFALLQQK